MSRLSWNASGLRFFEAGVDRGVLYLPGQAGVPWNGLVSVIESPSGGEAKAFYFDAIKYLNLSTAEEYEGTINALSSPSEFSVCDGNVQIHNGLYAAQQPRVSFSMSYRTLIGNDLGPEVGYKIHLIYNVLAAPSQRNNNTLSNSADPNAYSWPITTLPPSITGYKPTAHLVIDSRYADPEVLSDVEDLLYGTDITEPSIPDPDDLVEMFA